MTRLNVDEEEVQVKKEVMSFEVAPSRKINQAVPHSAIPESLKLSAVLNKAFVKTAGLSQPTLSDSEQNDFPLSRSPVV